MSVLTGQPQQHKQPSRKGKKAWRKHVDITDVQSGLEALREEIIQGGPISEKKAEDLFALDITGSEEVRRKLKSQKLLKADEILARRSQVPGVDSRKRSSTTLSDAVSESANKRLKKDWVSKKEVQRLKQVANTISHIQGEEESVVYDVWGGEPSIGSEEAHTLEYIPHKKAKVPPTTIKKAPIAMTASGRAVPAIKNPAAGTSYNPSFDEWDELLDKEGAKELAAEEARLRQAEAEAEKQRRIEAAAKDDMNAMNGDDSAWEGFETEPEDNELKKKRPQRKTPQQRNKLKRRKEAERLAKHEKRMADKQKQAKQLASVSSSMIKMADGSLQPLSNTIANDIEDVDDTKLRRRRIGNAPIPEKRLELVLPDELQESLRQLKPEGNLLQDRFRTLLVNGKIESRKPVLTPKKKKTKLTEKWSHKDFSIQV